MNGKNKNLFQMFIMKKELFFEYCEFLFGVLFDVERQRNYEEGYTINGKRTLGYLGEIMLTMFLLMKEPSGVKVSNLGIAHINNPVTKEEYNKIFVKNIIKNIFSIRNEGYYKILRLLGLKIKFKRKFFMLQNEISSLNRKIEEQNTVIEKQACDFFKQIEYLNSHFFSFWNGENYVNCNCLYDAFIRQVDSMQFYKLCVEYFSLRNIESYSNTEILIYIVAMLNIGKHQDATKMLATYVECYGKKDIWRYLPVAKFAKEQGITDENIEKAAFVFDKLEENRKNKLFEKLVEGKTIAVVGNGPSEIGKGKGAEIGSHDIVIRINNYQIEGFEQDYGTKTDIWVKCSSDDIEHKLRDDNIQLIIYEPDYLRHDLITGYLEALYESKREIDYFDFEDHVKLRTKLNLFPSTGLVLAEKLLTCCNVAKLDLYGFSFLADCKNKNMKIHYYNTDKCEIEAKKRCSHHSFQKESEYLRKALNV